MANTQQPVQAAQPSGGSDDRRSKQSKSSAAALAAAAMLKVMCFKEMADAQRENDSEKMSRAMMMCAQADAMAQNGKENEEGAKKSGSGAMAAVASPQFEKPDLDTSVKPDEFDSTLFQEANSKTNSATSSDSTGLADGSTEAGNGSIQPADTFSEDKNFNFGASSASKNTSPSIDSGRLTLREEPVNALLNGGMLPDSPGRSPASLSGFLGSADFLKNSSPPSNGADSLTPDKRKNDSETNSGANPSGGFDEMLAKYMGAGNNTSISSASLSGGVIDIAYGLKVSGQRPKTIFEFASEQFRQKRPSELPSRSRNLK